MLTDTCTGFYKYDEPNRNSSNSRVHIHLKEAAKNEEHLRLTFKVYYRSDNYETDYNHEPTDVFQACGVWVKFDIICL